jgi:hypothetical protein
MITGRPDLSLNLSRLEREIQAFRQEVNARDQWFIREKYVDRAQMDPFYILLFTHQLEDRGDDLMGEPLFATRATALTVKRLTRLPEGTDRSYWRPITRDDLIARLDRFMTMYREDFLQPPGYIGDRQTTSRHHPRFRNKRFLYRIGSPGRSIIGVGSQRFANRENCGALRGRVVDENGRPLVGAAVELISETRPLRRITSEGGLFWFSRVPFGNYNLSVVGKSCIIRISQEEFGNARGTLFNSNRRILTGENIEFYAPDEELFEAVSDARGSYSVANLISGPYRVKVAGHQITGA